MAVTILKGTPERSICPNLEGHDLNLLHSLATPQSWYLSRRTWSLSQVCSHPWTLPHSKDKYIISRSKYYDASHIKNQKLPLILFLMLKYHLSIMDLHFCHGQRR